MMLPEADHVNTSICPGVSMNTYLACVCVCVRARTIRHDKEAKRTNVDYMSGAGCHT